MLTHCADADAIIKGFASSVSTGILLCVTPVLFNTKFNALTIPGSIIVFAAFWLYIDQSSKGVQAEILENENESCSNIKDSFPPMISTMKVVSILMPPIHSHVS